MRKQPDSICLTRHKFWGACTKSLTSAEQIEVLRRTGMQGKVNGFQLLWCESLEKLAELEIAIIIRIYYLQDGHENALKS